MHSRLILLCVTALLGACTMGAKDPPAASITGTATYRERMMLPPSATLEVALEDVSRADAPADIAARTEVQTGAKGPPYSFTLTYDPARINPRHRYNVRARVMADGALIFQSDAGYAVLGSGNVTHVDILLRRASSAASDATSALQNMRGMYSYMADAGWFVDCPSGVRLAVAQEGDNAALESAYSKARSMAGVPMLTTVQAHVQDRPPMEGTQTRPTLIVEKFISVEAEQGCSGPSSTAQLENTYWKVMTLDGKSIETPEGTREVHIVLNSQNQRVTGFPGCNRMSGSYVLDGEKITFNQIAGTMMACVDGMDTEEKIHGMFGRVAGWKIAGETLQFTDANGMVVATFESRYMK